MRRNTLVRLAMLAIGALVAPTAAAQCWHGCRHHNRPGWGPGPQAWQERGLGPVRGEPAYDPDTVTTLGGNVVAVEVVPSQRGRMGGIHIVVKDNEQLTEIHVAPMRYLETEGFTIAKGDMVEVTGSLVSSEDDTYMIAREVKKGDRLLRLRNKEGIPLWSRSRRSP